MSFKIANRERIDDANTCKRKAALLGKPSVLVDYAEREWMLCTIEKSRIKK